MCKYLSEAIHESLKVLFEYGICSLSLVDVVKRRKVVIDEIVQMKQPYEATIH